MEFFKSTLGRVVAVLFAVFLVLLSVKTGMDAIKSYRDSHELYKNTIAVTADDKVVAKPDVAVLDLSVVSRGATVALVTKDNTNKMNAILTAVKGLGVEEKDIRTTSYYLNPEYDMGVPTPYGISSNSTPKILGYTLTQGVAVKVRQIDKSGDVLQKATEAGANAIGNVSFTIDDPDQLKNQAREKAFAKAKAKAQTLADQAGVHLGKIVSFSDDTGAYMPYENRYYAADAKGGVAMPESLPAPSIEPGTQDVSATVSVTYEIY